jgi:hypothetical protein
MAKPILGLDAGGRTGDEKTYVRSHRPYRPSPWMWLTDMSDAYEAVLSPLAARGRG